MCVRVWGGVFLPFVSKVQKAHPNVKISSKSCSITIDGCTKRWRYRAGRGLEETVAFADSVFKQAMEKFKAWDCLKRTLEGGTEEVISFFSGGKM